jgi:hypothetical protein
MRRVPHAAGGQGSAAGRPGRPRARTRCRSGAHPAGVSVAAAYEAPWILWCSWMGRPPCHCAQPQITRSDCRLPHRGCPVTSPKRPGRSRGRARPRRDDCVASAATTYTWMIVSSPSSASGSKSTSWVTTGRSCAKAIAAIQRSLTLIRRPASCRETRSRAQWCAARASIGSTSRPAMPVSVRSRWARTPTSVAASTPASSSARVIRLRPPRMPRCGGVHAAVERQAQSAGVPDRRQSDAPLGRRGNAVRSRPSPRAPAMAPTRSGRRWRGWGSTRQGS